MKENARAAFDLWFRVAGIVLIATALVAFLTGFFSRKFYLQTGNARWIWIDHDFNDREPIAFFAVRDVDVPANPPFVRLRIACDAEWTLYLNGAEIGGGEGSAEPKLYVFDLTDIARGGETNRFLVALRSADGVGGLLASIDYAPLRENDVVTDGSWKLCRTWTTGLANGEGICGESPVVIGLPPVGRWNYPEPVEGSLYTPGQVVLRSSVEVADTEISRREIRVISGLAVESSQRLAAKLFDFGSVEGRGRVTLPKPAGEVRLVEARYVTDLSDLTAAEENEAFVFAPGESTVTQPVPRTFRFLAVAEPDASVSIVTSQKKSQQ